MTRDYENARMIEEQKDHDEARLIAIQKFVNAVAGTETDTDVGPIEATYRALDELEAQGVIGTEDLAEDVDAARETAEAALALAQQPADENKAQRARELTRNELVRRYVVGTGHTSIAITNSKVQELARPEHELEWETVDRAFGKLVDRWDAFGRTTDSGEKALTVMGSVSDQLARIVAVELGREDIANTVVGEKEGEA